jgi:hypothetical protein
VFFRIPLLWFVVVILFHNAGFAQTLNLPARPANAPGGAAFKELLLPLSFESSNRQLSPREVAILGQILQGNVPNWMRNLSLVTTNATINGTNHIVSYYVTPEYIAIGSDQDYFLMPMTPMLGQRIADSLNCSLTTAKMVDDIWKKAPAHLSPSPITYVPEFITIPYYDQHNTTVRGQRDAITNSFPIGTLTGGYKKDVIIANRIYTNFANSSITNVVVIYGWHYLDGSHIQDVYNGHEEGYADYSHGIRLVQMGLTVDGQPNTVTNVLTNPNLAALLSDDSILANRVIPKPRYSLLPMKPSITSQPRSQTVASNDTVTFSAFAVGDTTLHYQWRFNDTNIVGATNANLTLNTAQATDVGSYTVVISNSAGSATSIPALFNLSGAAHPILFRDGFETNSSSLWDLTAGSGNGTPDYTVDWAFDYSHESYTFNGAGYFIPPAPHSTGAQCRGVRLTANSNDTNGVIAAVNLYPKGVSFSNDYTLKFDMWINYPGGIAGAGATGSTEYALCGLNHLGTQPNWAATSASSTDGLWFAVDGEGGVAADYRAFVGNLTGTQTELTGVASGLTQGDSSAALYTNLFPATRHESAGAPGKNWVEAELRQVGGIITWLLDGTVIAQRTNTSAFTSGKVMIGFMDSFASIASPSNQAFVIFDNVRVEDLGQTLQLPYIGTPPQNLQLNAGSDATFVVSAGGSAPLFYQWFFNNTAIGGATNTSLQLTNVHSTDSGTYAVEVNNAAGLARATATLSVASQPAHFQSIARDGSGHAYLNFSGDVGLAYSLEASTDLAVWKTISVLAMSNGLVPFLDLEAPNFTSRYYRTRSRSSFLFADFETYANGSTVLFLSPSSSGSTTNFVDSAAAAFCYVTNSFPPGHDSTKVLAASWTFRTGTTNPWMRWTSFNAPNVPNPVIGTNQAVQFDIFCDKGIYVTLGLRETSPTGVIGSNGGTSGSIEWVGGTTANTNPPKGRVVPANQWTTLTFFPAGEPVLAFTGNGVLETTTGKVVLEQLAIVPTVSGPHSLFLDNMRLIDLAP